MVFFHTRKNKTSEKTAPNWTIIAVMKTTKLKWALIRFHEFSFLRWAFVRGPLLRQEISSVNLNLNYLLASKLCKLGIMNGEDFGQKIMRNFV